MRLLLISLVLLVAAGLLYTLGGPWNVNVRTQAFRDAIRGADEVVIGSGGGYILRDMLDCGAHETVFTRITDPAALRTLARNLEFEADPDPGCKCCGYPGLDW